MPRKFSPEEYKTYFFPTYPIFSYINDNVSLSAKILLAGEARNYYLKRPYQLSSALDYSILKKYVAQSQTVDEFTLAIKKDGFSYLLVNFHELERLQKIYANMAAADEKKLFVFLRSLEPVFSRGPINLYAIP